MIKQFKIFRKKKILITGFNGFKGTWLCLILKILGATPKRVAYLWFKEYFIIGLISSVVSLIIGFFVSYVLLNYVFNIEINVDYKTIFILSLLVPFLITLFSLFRMIGLIKSKPLVVLRSHF